MSPSANDVRFNELKDMIRQLNTTIEGLNQTITLQNKLLAEKEGMMAEMKAELEHLRKKLYGASKERTPFTADPDQLSLFGDSLEEPEPMTEPVDGEVIDTGSTADTEQNQRKRKPTLTEQFKDIPTKRVEINALSDADKLCPVCDAQMQPIGQEIIRSEVIHVPPTIYRIEYVATTYGCPVCKDTEDPQFIKDDDAPKALIEGSYVSPSLAAWVFYQKFALAVPFYRLEKSFEELGAQVGRSSMARWAILCSSRYFQPMTDFFHRKLLKRKFLMMDETVIQVLKEPDKRPESKSYVWLMRSGEDGLPPIVYYRYSPSRSGDTALELTEGIESGTYLMCDAFSGYNKLKDVKRCICYAHIRRYLYEAIPKGQGNDLAQPAVQGVMYCNKLFDYERRYAEKALSPEQRRKRRLKDEKPVIEAFLAWADAQPVNGNGKLAKAITYIRNRREYMLTYLEDGRCSLSNNPSENSIRPITVGRKNWLFCNSVDGANASTTIYTIVEMAKLYGLSRHKYLEYLLEKRPSAEMSDEELEQLAPWNEEVQKACRKCENAEMQ